MRYASTAPLPPPDYAACADADLVALVRQGDEAAVRTLVQRHNRRLYRAARAIIRDDAEAEDIVQETYVRAFTGLAGFRGEAGLATWLTRIALNEALGRLRRRRTAAAYARTAAPEPRNGAALIMFPTTPVPPTPEAELARSQVRTLLEQAIEQLPAAFRVVLILRDIEGLSTEETAEQLAIRPETVKTRLHRARRLMRATLDRHVASIFSDLFPFDGARCNSMADRVIGRLRGTRAGYP